MRCQRIFMISWYVRKVKYKKEALVLLWLAGLKDQTFAMTGGRVDSSIASLSCVWRSRICNETFANNKVEKGPMIRDASGLQEGGKAVDLPVRSY